MDKRLESGSRSITPASPARVSGAGETYDLPRACAMFDKPYLAQYTRGPGGSFIFAGAVKPESRSGDGSGNAAPSVKIDAREIRRDSRAAERCAWCGVKGEVIYCERCGAWVCPGRMTKRNGADYFRCRASCGEEGSVVAVNVEWHGSKSQAPHGENRRALPPGNVSGGALAKPETRAALPAADRPRLKP